jgi:hypothetical protein
MAVHEDATRQIATTDHAQNLYLVALITVIGLPEGL